MVLSAWRMPFILQAVPGTQILILQSMDIAAMMLLAALLWT